jgi:organic radical activating enzyme
VAPPFPRTVLLEVSNLCNHRCVFCAYPKMTRPGRRMDLDMTRKILADAYGLGAREAGFYSGAEPFTSPDLEAIVGCAKSLGYEYTFISTNGSLATEKRLTAIIDNGLDSIKFSINAGDRETYRRIHGQDHFDRVLASLQFAHEYREKTGASLYISVSFVGIQRDEISNVESRGALEALVHPWVDEVLVWDANSQNSASCPSTASTSRPRAICACAATTTRTTSRSSISRSRRSPTPGTRRSSARCASVTSTTVSRGRSVTTASTT